jgi:hypothetical protein
MRDDFLNDNGDVVSVRVSIEDGLSVSALFLTEQWHRKADEIAEHGNGYSMRASDGSRSAE